MESREEHFLDNVELEQKTSLNIFLSAIEDNNQPNTITKTKVECQMVILFREMTNAGFYGMTCKQIIRL